MSTIKYAAILDTKKKDRIIEEFVQNTSMEFEIEIKRIISFYGKYNLDIDDRKKIISKGSGNWLGLQAENKILYIVLIDKNLLETWGYQFLDQLKHQIHQSFGNEFHTLKPKRIQTSFQKNFAKTIKKFNEFFASNVLSQNVGVGVGPTPQSQAPPNVEPGSTTVPEVVVSKQVPS